MSYRYKSSSRYCCSSSSSDDCYYYQKKDCCRDECPPKNCIVDDFFTVTNLVSNQTGVSSNQDLNLINPWGIIVQSNRLYVANNGTGTITSYSLNGAPITPVITVPPAITGIGSPTGLVSNTGTNFIITSGSLSGPATLITCTEDGTISAYNATVNATSTIVTVNRSSINANYKGLALVANNLYVADFRNNRIDVFDDTFSLLPGYAFVDPSMPIGFAPYNITYVCGKLYVTYAKQDGTATNDVSGLGNGFVSMFSTQGVFLGRFLSGGYLNSPWGIIRVREDTYAPVCTGCGVFLISNYGDGTIGVYSERGVFIGRLRDRCDVDIIIGGLRGIIHGRQIYFSSGPNNETNGTIGSITRC